MGVTQLDMTSLRNQDNSRRTVNVEDTSSKAMLAIDGAGLDWSYMADDEVPTNMALMAFSDSEEFQKPELEGYGPKTSKSVSEDIADKVRESPDALLVEELVSQKPKGNQRNWNNLKSQQLGTACVCFVLSPDFKLPDESQILLKIPRKNNMYSVDMKNIVPKDCLTCLVAKATLDESMLWHRRLGHINFKTLNKVKDNLVRGIKREYSVAKTPQQNGVAKMRNRTLIEEARTTLADSKLPTTFWAEAVNTAFAYHLGKFDGKSDDGFFVGYSLTIKAFRVYNIRTRKVEENLHIRFLKDKPIVLGDGPKWLFDIDSLTKSMNYVSVIAGTNSNDFADNSSYFDSPSTNVSHDEPEPSCDAEKKDDEGVSKASGVDDQEIPESSTPNINTAGPSINTASANLRTGSLHINTVSPTVLTTRSNCPQSISDIISLRGQCYSLNPNADLFGDETEMDMSNLNASYHVPTTPNTRIHKDHSLDHVIEPKRVTKTLSDSAWVEAMQEELLQFKLQKVWVLVDLPKGKRAIDYNEVFAPVARIEAIRLFLAYASFMGFMVYKIDVKRAFLYGQIKEEVYVCQPLGFEDPDYPDKVYKVVKALYGLHQSPRACNETSPSTYWTNGFRERKIDQNRVYQEGKRGYFPSNIYVDDIIFLLSMKDLCLEFEKLMHDKFQMSSIGERTFFLGLQVKQKEHGIFISGDKYVTDILNKFGFQDVRTARTPMDTEKPLLKDSDGDDVDVHLYRFQVTPKVAYSHAVKRIFRYLKGKPKLGLWYPRDSPFDLVAYSNSNYAGASLDRKSTAGCCQCPKMQIDIRSARSKPRFAHPSSIEAEYVAAASCCGQVLWIQNQMLDYGYC
ncbi:putative ribonuclease H-like domain-containing protein [Tanacetum coccineum]